MTKQEYYLEAINCSLDEMGCFESLTDEQKQQLSKDIETSVDCIGMAFYSPSEHGIESSEIKALKARIKELDKEAEDWRMAFKKNVSNRRGWEINEIYIDKTGEAYTK